MALYGIGETRVHLYLVQNGKIYDAVVKDEITLTRETNSASKLSCSILRDSVSAEAGDVVALVLDDQHNQFYGYITTSHHKRGWCEIEAYDQLYYLNRNKMRISYQDITADQLVERIAKDRGYSILDPPQFENTEYLIPLRIEENVSELSIITTALDLTRENTGKRFYIWDDFGSLTLTSESWMAGETTCFIMAGYLEDYDYVVTIDDRYTAARFEKELEDTEGEKQEGTIIETTVSYCNEAIEKYGFLELQGTVEEKENAQNKAEQELLNNLAPATTLSLTGVQGDITVRGGTPVAVDFFTRDRQEYIRGWFRVLTVTHKIGPARHTMDLSCELIEMKDDWGNTSPDYWSA